MRSSEMICVESAATAGRLSGSRDGKGLKGRSLEENRFSNAILVPLSVTINGVERASRTNLPVASCNCLIVIIFMARLCHKRHLCFKSEIIPETSANEVLSAIYLNFASRVFSLTHAASRAFLSASVALGCSPLLMKPCAAPS
jgi:hypothetical protein